MNRRELFGMLTGIPDVAEHAHRVTELEQIGVPRSDFRVVQAEDDLNRALSGVVFRVGICTVFVLGVITNLPR